MSWVADKYQGLDGKERKQLWTLVIFSLSAAYLFYAAYTWEQMFQTEKMANRRADRIEKRIGEIKPPELEDGISQAVMDGLSKKIAEQEKLLKAFSGPLLPMGDSEAREELKLTITRLANMNQLRLSSLKSSNFRRTGSLAELHGQELRTFFESRPGFQLSLSGQYLNVLRFVEALQGLQYQVSVASLAIERLNDDNSLLKIEMELRL